MQELSKAGLITDAGWDTINIAKENGSWSVLDDVEALITPNDLQNALNKQPQASLFFSNLTKSKKKILLYWVQSAKTDKTRNKRIEEIVSAASDEVMPKPFR